ncbi:hypothetical protein CK203_025339 [Vitis vinifera]|uniref:Uncharacterized protein n=1 Tax=Vitis vinifera TaxID=29760 RepID=A0A438IZG8_VITVI|nr:hypothetical protein CK203_025339 [Vitis vinifera]
MGSEDYFDWCENMERLLRETRRLREENNMLRIQKCKVLQEERPEEKLPLTCPTLLDDSSNSTHISTKRRCDRSYSGHAKLVFLTTSTTACRPLIERGPLGFVNGRLDDMISTPFNPYIIDYEPPRGFMVPKFTTYDKTSDPFDHILHYRLRRVIWNPWQSNEELKFMKNQALELHSPLPKSFKVCKERALERGKQSEENRGQQLQSSCALLDTQFGVEMKELQPLQTDHSKLKEEFCKVLRNQPFVAKSAFCCENFAAFLHSVVDFLLKLPDICDTLEAENLKVEANFVALRR